MLVITARNVNAAWFRAKCILATTHVLRPSRVGQVMEYPTPVTTCYLRPTERVLFDERRDANPFFHFMEGLWMLAGRSDVAWIAQFNQRMKKFSDDGKTFHGAYGRRWRKYFEPYGGGALEDCDQLVRIARMLANYEERRAVLQVWDAVEDLDRPDLKDLPCNTTIFFKVRDGRLTMTVCNRSNDIIWGCYGSNVVHMSMLQEYMAGLVGVPVGVYYQVSDSWHAYTERWERYTGGSFQEGKRIGSATVTAGALHCGEDYYTTFSPRAEPYPMVEEAAAWDSDLHAWMIGTEYSVSVQIAYSNSFFPRVAQPLFEAWRWWKDKQPERALETVRYCLASDWRIACEQWMQRRALRAKLRLE